jgi:hypothetical protein
MSQHSLETRTDRNQTVVVTLGWDRPLQEFFASVRRCPVSTQITGPDEDDDGVLYNSVYDVEADGTLDHLRTKLTALGIAVPAIMFVQVQLDARTNAGNRLVTYATDGSFTEQAQG